jgi:hypothetical protein
MDATSRIVAFLGIAALAYVTLRGNLPTYASLLGI